MRDLWGLWKINCAVNVFIVEYLFDQKSMRWNRKMIKKADIKKIKGVKSVEVKNYVQFDD